MNPLFGKPLSVLNVGLPRSPTRSRSAAAPCERLEWSPPAGGDRALGAALARLVNHPRSRPRTKSASSAISPRSRLEGIGVAREALPDMGERMILHAGPPIAWARMCGPMQGAIVGAILYEGWASDAEAARAGRAGEIAFEPCHHHAAVGPMAGIISPSMPVWMCADRDARQPRLQQPQRGAGQGAALRRQQRRRCSSG